jgi:hypothetical protein
MEQIFKLIHHIILDKHTDYEANTLLLKKCKEIDDLIKKRFIFKDKPEIHEYKSYNTQVKYLMKNFFYKKINIYRHDLKETELEFDIVKENYKLMLKNKEIKKKMFHSWFPKKTVLMYNIFGITIFQSHCLTVLSTFPTYSPNEFHSKIYKICLEIDNILENDKYKEIYYYFLLDLIIYLEKIGSIIVYPLESKLIHSNKYKTVKKTQKFILDKLFQLK